MTQKKYFIITFVILFLFSSNETEAQIKDISIHANKLISDTALSGGHVGICIYDAGTEKLCYKYNADKYFIPASTTKLFSTFACLKFLGDSLSGIRYKETKDTIYIVPTGDPTLLAKDFINQRVYDFLKNIKKPIRFEDVETKMEKFGRGWAWDDYNEDYMAERSSFPVYENLVSVNCTFAGKNQGNHELYMNPMIKQINVHFNKNSAAKETTIKRDLSGNNLEIIYNEKDADCKKKIPFYTNGSETAIQILKEKIPTLYNSYKICSASDIQSYNTIKSQSTDSVLRKMMFESDNFYAEQLLLMSSNQKLGFMSDQIFIDSLLSNELKELPQQPQWIDGSGLSRYNLFTPESFVFLLNKMKNEFGLERLKKILPTGGKGTLKNYYQPESNFIFAKTGTLSNHSALSGYLITKKGKLLIFSVMANNYFSKASSVRKGIEKFLRSIRNEN